MHILEFEEEMTADQALEIFREAEGIAIVDQREDGGYMTPQECAGDDAVFISRLRDDFTVDHGVAFWCVSDNLRKGAALNTVQIAEKLATEYL